MVATKLQLRPETRLERHVAKWVRDETANYDGDMTGPLKDLFYGGCASGMVGHLVYYTDTCRFYRRYKADIAALLREAMDGCGDSPASVFGDKWDATDPLAYEDRNQNLLAWFGFEEAALNLANRAGYDG
jgi:hypothetical protein